VIRCAVVFGVVLIGAAQCSHAAAPTSQSTTSQQSTTSPSVDAQTWAIMTAIDEKVGRITDLRADFEQQKHTPLLKKPLISSGKVLLKGSQTHWDIQKPEPTVMFMDAKEIRLYYPKQSMLEIYPIEGDLGSLAASPLPRLEILKRFFSFERIDPAELDPQADVEKTLALRMTPTDDSLRQHVREVRVLLSRETGFILRAETRDTDGDRTMLIFSNPQADTGLRDEELRLNVPANTTISRPLDGLNGETK
jgi:outer membrane lipoprotein-sorting protein